MRFVLLACLFAASLGGCPGVCQPTTMSCSSSYQQVPISLPFSFAKGDCPGGWSIQCCPASTSCSGQCQDISLSCDGQYVSGLCPGPTSIQCCQQGTQQRSRHDHVSLTLNSDDWWRWWLAWCRREQLRVKRSTAMPFQQWFLVFDSSHLHGYD